MLYLSVAALNQQGQPGATNKVLNKAGLSPPQHPQHVAPPAQPSPPQRAVVSPQQQSPQHTGQQSGVSHLPNESAVRNQLLLLQQERNLLLQRQEEIKRQVGPQVGHSSLTQAWAHAGLHAGARTAHQHTQPRSYSQGGWG